MNKTIPLAMILSAVLAFGCAGDDVDEYGETSSELVMTTKYERGGESGILFDVGDVCLALIPLFPSSNISPWSIDYDATGRIISSEFDLDGDGAADASCAFGYESGQITVALDLGMDGNVDSWGAIDQHGWLIQPHRGNLGVHIPPAY